MGERVFWNYLEIFKSVVWNRPAQISGLQKLWEIRIFSSSSHRIFYCMVVRDTMVLNTGSSVGEHISKELSKNPEIRELFFEAQEKRKLANYVSHLRKQKMGLTQKELAKMAGVTQAYIARIEKGI